MKTNLIGMILNNAGRRCFEGALLDDDGKPMAAADSLHTLIMEHAKVAAGGTSSLVAVAPEFVRKQTTADIGPRQWWLCEAEDPSRGATWTREPDADDIAFVEKHTGCKHVARRLVLE